MARPASDISTRIVKAARERFLEEGVDGASLRAIARDAGTNLGMVYYYFPTKDDLFLAVVEETYGRILEDVSVAVSAEGQSTEQRILGLYRYFATLTDDDMKVVRLILKEAMASSTRLKQLFERFRRGHVPLVAAMLMDGTKRGEVRSDLPILALAIATFALGLAPQAVRRRLAEAGVGAEAVFPEPEALATALSKLIVEGLAPREASVASHAVEARSTSQTAEPSLASREEAVAPVKPARRAKKA